MGRLRIRLGVPALFLSALALGACGGTALSATTTTNQGGARASAGPVNPRAVPLGDGHLSTSPRVGYVDSCVTHFGGGGGAQVNGPWISTRTRTWSYVKKLAVSGAVRWPDASYHVRISHGRRAITFNDLPIDHTTGVFPIARGDPAFQYDRNPNHIAARSLAVSLPLNPKPAGSPGCTPLGPIGVLDDGVVLYNALDALGRDAGAHEVLDRCAGHPDPSSTYHHHDIPPFLNKAPAGRSMLVGYAFDGYGIYVEKSSRQQMPSDARLDACHGKTSRVRWNGRTVRVYHYVATLEYPYTVGCFHATDSYSGR